MNNLIFCAILTVFEASIQAELIAGRNSASTSTRYEIPNDQEELNNEYKVSLFDFAKNHLEDAKINIVLSSSDCIICDGILGVLMNASTQSFLTVNDIHLSNYSIVNNATGLVSGIGYYNFVLFLMENVGEFFKHFSKLRSMHAWNPRVQHLIFTVEKPDDKELEMIFNECWSDKVLNVAVIIVNQQEAYTYNPYLKNHFEMREKVRDWSKLLYDKLRNMNGHSIVARYVPYAGFIAKWIHEEGRYKFFGSDFGYGKAFFQIVNATPDFINLTADMVPCYKNFGYRNVIWNERKFRGAELWLNFMPYMIVLRDRHEKTYPLRRENLRILAPKSGLKTPSIFEPYNSITWICVALSIVTFALYSCVFYKWRGIEDNAFLRTFGIFLGKNMAKRRHGLLERLTFLVFTMVSLLILSAYQGALYGALATVSYYPEINTMSELEKRTQTISTYQVVVESFRNYTPRGFRVLGFGTGNYISYMQTHRDEAFVFPNSIAQVNAKLKSLSEEGVPFFHIMSDYSIPNFVSHNLPYGSPYLKKLEKVYLICNEAGLTEYWKEEANLDAILSGDIIPNVAEGRILKKLSLETQLTAFYIWGLGLLVSSFCFITEIYNTSTKNCKKTLAGYWQKKKKNDNSVAFRSIAVRK